MHVVNHVENKIKMMVHVYMSFVYHKVEFLSSIILLADLCSIRA